MKKKPLNKNKEIAKIKKDIRSYIWTIKFYKERIVGYDPTFLNILELDIKKLKRKLKRLQNSNKEEK